MTAIKTEVLYLYCIAEGSVDSDLDITGVDDNEVYTIQYDDLYIVVHKCSAEVYKSDVKEKVEGWILSHQNVIDAVWRQCGNVLPMGFNTIIKNDEEKGLNAEDNLREWLKKDYEMLKEKLSRVRNKEEYGVQIFWAPKVMINDITQSVPEIRKLNEELKSKPPGTAYMYEQKLKGLLKKQMELRADECFKEFYGKIRPIVDYIRVDKTKKTDNELQMLMNLSCLAYKYKVKELGQVLDEIQKRGGFSVRFTGPWPPYSFV